MKRAIKNVCMMLGLSIALAVSSQAQGLPEDNMKVFENMPDTLVYASGVGAWANELFINADGSFTGSYWDSDMGDAGEGYPHGTLYLCDYNGQFEVPAKVTDTIYKTELMYISTDELSGCEEIVDRMRYVYTDAYGIEGGDTFYIYLPGTPRSAVPECALYSPIWSYESRDAQYVPRDLTILYNEKADICFVGKKLSDWEYVLPSASTRRYTRDEISKLTLQEVNYAKNEIYAVHGRLFKSRELQDFFETKSWYDGYIDGNAFNDSVFNDIEQANLKLLVDRETELAGPDGYILNEPGYDIYAVRLGALEDEDLQPEMKTGAVG